MAETAGSPKLLTKTFQEVGIRVAHVIAMMVLIPALARALPGVPLVACGSVIDRAGLGADVIREVFGGGPQGAREVANALEVLAKSNSQH